VTDGVPYSSCGSKRSFNQESRPILDDNSYGLDIKADPLLDLAEQTVLGAALEGAPF